MGCDDEHVLTFNDCNDVCVVFNWIGFVLFLSTTIKSVVDLIICEIIYKDTPFFKMTWRKLFHFLLPISEAAICFSCIYLNMYCKSIKMQTAIHTLVTAGSGYVLVFCFLCNALHWAYLTSQSENRKFPFFYIGLIIMLFIVFPVILETLIIVFYYKDKDKDKDFEVVQWIHFAELIYIVLLNICVIGCMFFCWHLLNSRLKDFAEIQTISKLRKRVTKQMILYCLFFSIRTLFLLIPGILGQIDDDKKFHFINSSLFFASGAIGDIPLVFVMLHFLQYKKPSNSSSSVPPLSSPNNPSVSLTASTQSLSEGASIQEKGGFDGMGGYGSVVTRRGGGQGQDDGERVAGYQGTEQYGESVPINAMYFPESSSGSAYELETHYRHSHDYNQNSPYYYSPQQNNGTATATLINPGYYQSGEGYV